MAAPASAATSNYVALGDSYSSGVGTDNYYSNSGSCDRSPQGYPAFWAAAHSVSSFSFEACSGAKTGDVLNNQLGALNSSTTLVTMTIGGNDAGFASVMTTCAEQQSDSACLNAVNNALNLVHNQLPGLLDNLYNAIRNDAPNARVVILGYPELYSHQDSSSCWFDPLDMTERGYVNHGADVLDQVTADAAARHGFAYADVRSDFSGHLVCDGSSGNWWLKAIDLLHSDSFHPNARGYLHGYLPALDSVTG